MRDKVTRQCPQTTTCEAEKGEPKQIRTEVPLLTSLTPTARPNRLTKKQSTTQGYIRTNPKKGRVSRPRRKSTAEALQSRKQGRCASHRTPSTSEVCENYLVLVSTLHHPFYRGMSELCPVQTPELMRVQCRGECSSLVVVEVLL